MMNHMVMESHGWVSEQERHTLERSVWLQHGARIGAAENGVGRSVTGCGVVPVREGSGEREEQCVASESRKEVWTGLSGPKLSPGPLPHAPCLPFGLGAEVGHEV